MAQSGQSDADWPIMRRLVSTGTVDLLSTSQGNLLSNHLSYRPRPVFQSYSAYTPGLLRLNESAIASPRGPDFLVACLEPIDGHLPMLEDGAVWQQVFQHYRPVTVEKSNLLLARDRSRDSRVALPAEEILLERMVRFNENVLVPGAAAGFQRLALDFRPTWWGRLRSFLLRPPRLYIHLKLSDGREHQFRVVPALAKSGFLLSPFIGNCDDILKLYGRPGIARVVSFRLLIADDPAAMNQYIGLRLSSLPNLVAYQPGRPGPAWGTSRDSAARPDQPRSSPPAKPTSQEPWRSVAARRLAFGSTQGYAPGARGKGNKKADL
jgi:hypothetical protein